ncbi:MAG: hypothetical protein ACP5OC_01425 [Thermoplasmata archaeon]
MQSDHNLSKRIVDHGLRKFKNLLRFKIEWRKAELSKGGLRVVTL